MTARLCPHCQKPLTLNPRESKSTYFRRRFCNLRCSAFYREGRRRAMGKVPSLIKLRAVAEAARVISEEMLKRGSAPCTLEQELALRDALAALDAP